MSGLPSLLVWWLLSDNDAIAASVMAEWTADPVIFCRDNFGVELEDWQAEAIRELAKPLNIVRVAMIACKGPGKSFLEAMATLWWVATRPHAQVICTSITRDNLRDGLWKEIAYWYQKSEFLKAAYTLSGDRLSRVGPEGATWFISARSWTKDADSAAQADTLAGIHGPAMMYVGDEAGGYSAGVLPAAEAMLANAVPGSENYGRIMISGNPTDPAGPLFHVSTVQAHHWKILHITADPDDPKRSKRVSAEWARKQIEDYGRDNPWVQVNVFGKFPPSGMNTLLTPNEVLDAMKREMKPDAFERAEKRLGVDVARFGGDRTVLFPRQGLMTFDPVVMRQQNTVQITAKVIASIRNWSAEQIFIDDTGHWGHGVYDALDSAGYSAVPIQYQGPPQDPRYKNARAEMWFRMADWVKRGGCLPNIPELIGELTTPTYAVNLQGKIQLEDKDLVKAKLGRSPDLADALAQTFFYEEAPWKTAEQHRISQAVNTLAERETGGKVLSDWDPFEHERD